VDLIEYARLYVEKWKVTPIPISYVNDNQTPFVKWGDLAEKNEPVLVESEEVWRRATGIAILPRRNHVVIDIDDYADPDSLARRLVEDGLVVVRTRRGLHVHAEVDKPVGEIRIYSYGERIGEGGGSLFKHLWTVPPTKRGDFTYKFVNCEDCVPYLPKLSWDDFKTLIELEAIAKVEEITSKQLSGSDITLSVEQVRGVEKLTPEQLKILLFLIYHDMGCLGLRDLVYEWLKDGQVRMRKFPWSNRTSRFYFLHAIAATLALLGVEEKRTAEVLASYEDIDGKPADSAESALYTIYRSKQALFKRLYIMKRGECPFCSLRGYRNCQKNPILRIYYYLQSRGRIRVEEMAAKLSSSQS